MFCGTSSSFSGAKHGSSREHFFKYLFTLDTSCQNKYIVIITIYMILK